VVVTIRITEWCVRSWDEIWMVHRSMKNGSRVADELNIKRVLIALEDFLFFSLYSFSCIANNTPTLEIYLDSCPSIRTSSLVRQPSHHLRPTPPVTLERVIHIRT